MSTKRSLLNMPDVVMTKIFEKCDLLSILILRKVCHDLRNFIDDTKPEQFMTEIEIEKEHDSILLRLHITTDDDFYPKGGVIHIKYEMNSIGCEIGWWRSDGWRYKFIKDENMSEVFLRDLEAILNLRMPILEDFSIRGLFGDELSKKIGICLKNNSVRAKNVYISRESQALIIGFLRNIHKTEKISFIPGRRNEEPLEIDEIVKLDQWKHAKFFSCFEFKVLAPIQHFAHFESLWICPEDLSADSLKFLKELFLNSTSKSKCFYFYLRLNKDDELIKVFGEPSKTNTEESEMTWFYGKSSDSVLRIIVNRFRVSLENICFEDVPEGVRIIE